MPLQIDKLMNKNVRAIASACGFILASFLLIYPVNANMGTYKNSKHGSSSVGVQRDINLPRGNCSQCHFQHDGERPNDFGLFVASDNALCQTNGCHDAEYRWPAGDYYWSYPGNSPDWYNSGHGSSTSVFPPGSNRDVRLCVQCHNPHGTLDIQAGTYPSATLYLEEQGCYSNTGLQGDGCHGNNNTNRPTGAVDIYSQMLKTSRHNVEAQAKRHSSDWLADFPYGRDSRVTSSGSFSGNNRHVECVDCHNPHKAISGSHQIGTNTIGGPLLGTWGVQPANGGPWIVPTSFSTIEFTSLGTAKEYQLCLKCHSYYAFGNNAPNGYTDIAREFNPANASFHPVEGYVSDNSYTSPSAINNNIETMEAPWDNGRHDLMTCGDCHGSELATDPKGPHGSNKPYILFDSPGATETAFCTRCHKASVYAPLIKPGDNQETGSRFDQQTTGLEEASHWFHVTEHSYGCRQCHGGRQNQPFASPGQSTPYPIEVGSTHGTNSFSGLLNGTNIISYTPGSCSPTCHGTETYTAGPQ